MSGYAIGDLVEYNFRKVSGTKRKYGIVVAVRLSNQHSERPTLITVQWSAGYKEEYDSQHLIKVG